MSEPTISVVIPVFNRAATISTTLQSVFAQNFQDFEIVVVDDASQDDIEAALEPFMRGGRLRLIKNPINQGVSAARNTGVRAARGTFIAFLDSDDAWEPEKIERQLEALRRHPRPSRALCGTGTKLLLGDGAVRIRRGIPPPPGRSFGDYLFVDRGFTNPSAMLLARSLATEVPFHQDLRHYEDIAFFLELGAKGADYVVLEEPLTRCVVQPRPNSLSAQDNGEHRQRVFDLVSPILSPQARLAFQARFLAPFLWTERPTAALFILATALCNRVIGFRTFLLLLSQCVLGVKRHLAIRARILKTIARWRNQRAAAAS